jgi:hypothetical protein
MAAEETVERAEPPVTERLLPVIEELARAVRSELALARQISHPGESGRAREHVMANFVRTLIPSSYSVNTGFVLDTAGLISRQVDIVVHRTDYAPSFEIGGVGYFLAEAVAVAIEVKAAVSSRRELRTAIENIASVKLLDRTAGGHNYVLRGNIQGGPVVPGRFEHSVFGAIVTHDSLERNTFVQTYLEELRGFPRHAWPNLYIDVDDWWAGYQPVVADPVLATELAVSTAPTSPLAALAVGITNYLRVAELIDFKPGSYIPLTDRVTRHRLRDPEEPAS